MESLLIFYPTAAIGVCCIILASVKYAFRDLDEQLEKMYQLGKRHGKEELALKIYGDVMYPDAEDDDE